MTALVQLARVTRRGGSVTPTDITLNAQSTLDSVETRAWLIWSAMKEAAERSGETRIDGDSYVTIDTLKRHAIDLYPTAIEWGDPDAVKAFLQPVYKYLRATGNGRVIERNVGGSPTLSRWTLSQDWKAAGTTSGRTDIRRARPAKVKVTPQEAGEDREPAPVTVSYKNVEPEPTSASFFEQDALGRYICPMDDCDKTHVSLFGIRGHYGAAHFERPNRAKAAPAAAEIERDLVAHEPEGLPPLRYNSSGGVRHRTTADPDYPFGCPYCENNYKSNVALGGHMSKHTFEMMRQEVESLRAQVDQGVTPQVALRVLTEYMDGSAQDDALELGILREQNVELTAEVARLRDRISQIRQAFAD